MSGMEGWMCDEWMEWCSGVEGPSIHPIHPSHPPHNSITMIDESFAVDGFDGMEGQYCVQSIEERVYSTQCRVCSKEHTDYCRIQSIQCWTILYYIFDTHIFSITYIVQYILYVQSIKYRSTEYRVQSIQRSKYIVQCAEYRGKSIKVQVYSIVSRAQRNIMQYIVQSNTVCSKEHTDYCRIQSIDCWLILYYILDSTLYNIYYIYIA